MTFHRQHLDIAFVLLFAVLGALWARCGVEFQLTPTVLLFVLWAMWALSERNFEEQRQG
jgi:TctA family transporter